MSPCPCFVSHHTLTRQTFNSVFEKTSKKKKKKKEKKKRKKKKIVVLTDPQVWDHAYQKILKEDADFNGILEFWF